MMFVWASRLFMIHNTSLAREDYVDCGQFNTRAVHLLAIIERKIYDGEDVFLLNSFPQWRVIWWERLRFFLNKIDFDNKIMVKINITTSFKFIA